MVRALNEEPLQALEIGLCGRCSNSRLGESQRRGGMTRGGLGHMVVGAGDAIGESPPAQPKLAEGRAAVVPVHGRGGNGSFMSVRCVLVPSREIPPHRLKEFKPRASPCLAKKIRFNSPEERASPCFAKSKRFKW